MIVTCPNCGAQQHATTHTQARALTARHQRTCKEKKP